MTTTNEQVPFKLFEMPCCHHLLCWVNPRLPSYCPCCGKRVYEQLRFHGADHTQVDSPAWLRIENVPTKPLNHKSDSAAVIDDGDKEKG